MTALSRRDRAAVFILLIVIGGLAWACTLHQARLMDAMEAARWRDMNMSMNGMEASWTVLDVALMLMMSSAMRGLRADGDIPRGLSGGVLTALVTAEKLLPGGCHGRVGIGVGLLATSGLFFVLALSA